MKLLYHINVGFYFHDSFQYAILIILTNYEMLYGELEYIFYKFVWVQQFHLIDWLIDWCLTPTLAVFQIYRGIQFHLYVFLILGFCWRMDSCGYVNLKLDRYLYL